MLKPNLKQMFLSVVSQVIRLQGKKAFYLVFIGFILGLTSYSQERFNPNTQERTVSQVSYLLPMFKQEQTINVEIVDGFAVFEGDILLCQTVGGRIPKTNAAATAGNNYRWSESIMPYEIEAGHPETANILEAIKQINQQTNLKVVPREGQNDYVRFVNPPKAGCSSFVGRIGGKQNINISSCGLGGIQHEILHAAGVYHEQSRSDRDSYVKINTANIQTSPDDMRHNFLKVSGSINTCSYDFGSIMHYPVDAFSKNGGWTIEPIVALPAGVQMGQRNGLSACDIQGINKLYAPAAMTSSLREYTETTGGWAVSLHPRMMGDVNGDGKDDIVGFGNDGVWVSLSNGSDFKAGSMVANAFTLNTGGWSVAQHPRVMGDVNGDGKDDIVGFGNDGVFVGFSNGSGFEGNQMVLADFTINTGDWNTESHARVLGDVNGDGKADIVGFGNDGVFVSFSKGRGFEGKQMLLSDFTINTGGWSSTLFPRMMADVNGDKKDDIVGFGVDGVWVSFSTGSGFEGKRLLIADFCLRVGNWTTAATTRTMADMNGDGKADIVGFGNDGVWVSLSNGNGFEARTLLSSSFGTASGKWKVDKTVKTVGDINGNKKADILGFGEQYIQFLLQ